MQAAYQKSAVIEAAAYKKAEEIAGEAFAAQGKVKEYEQALKALKNAVDGYGDEYIKPSESVLDGLAEDFGFTEAGQKFKDARAYSKRLIKDNAAATWRLCRRVQAKDSHRLCGGRFQRQSGQYPRKS